LASSEPGVFKPLSACPVFPAWHFEVKLTLRQIGKWPTVRRGLIESAEVGGSATGRLFSFPGESPGFLSVFILNCR